MPTLLLTVRLAARQVEPWRRLAQELHLSRRPQFTASRRGMGIIRERFGLCGEVAFWTLEAAQVHDILPRLAASNAEFDRWFTGALREASGLEPLEWLVQAQGNTLLDWTADEEREA